MTQSVVDCMDVLLSQIRRILDEGDRERGIPSLYTDSHDEYRPDHGRASSGTGRILKEYPPLVKEHSMNMRSTGDVTPFWEQQAPVNTMTLPDIFDMLSSEDAGCIVCVRRIHRLGFKSVRYLRRFFSKFGLIRKIVLLPSRPKEWLFGSDAAIRPSSMCFILFDNRESVSGILSQEAYQVVSCDVTVSKYSPDHSYLSVKHARSQSRTSSMSSMETCSSP